MLALLSFVLQLPQPWFEGLVNDAAPIAVVRVEKLHEISQINGRMHKVTWPDATIRIAECRVEHMLLGDPNAQRVFVTLRVPRGEVYELQVGERAFVFADSDFFGLRASEDTRKRLDRLAGSDHVRPPMPGGVWRVARQDERDFVRLPDALGTLPLELDQLRTPNGFELGAWVEWLDHELDHVCPSIHMQLISTGPSSVWTRVRADGSWTAAAAGGGESVGKLDTDALARLWREVRVAKFEELPQRIGWSIRPDDSSYWIRTRTRAGVHDVRVFLFDETCEDDPNCGPLMKRARAVLDVLRSPKLKPR